MPRRLLSGLAIWTLVVGCGFALSETPAPAAQDVPTRAVAAVPDAPPPTPQPRPDPSVDEQMVVLEYHAKFNMILYTGRFGNGDLAATKTQLDAIALNLKAGSK